MQSTHFADFWQPRLAEAGYNAIFKKKGNDVYIGNNTVAIDGCATFFLRTRFQLVKKYEVNLSASKARTSKLHPAAASESALQSRAPALQQWISDCCRHFLAGGVQQGGAVAVRQPLLAGAEEAGPGPPHEGSLPRTHMILRQINVASNLGRFRCVSVV